MSSCSGVCATAPRTPSPPALVTAATTSRQWLKAKIGTSMPTRSVAGGRTGVLLRWGGEGRGVVDGGGGSAGESLQEHPDHLVGGLLGRAAQRAGHVGV